MSTRSVFASWIPRSRREDDRRRNRRQANHQFRPHLGDRLEDRITPGSGGSKAQFLPSADQNNHDVLSIVGFLNPTAVAGVQGLQVTSPSLKGDEVCVTVTNKSDQDITLTWAVYGASPDFANQTLVATYTVTVPAKTTRDVCAPTVACGQYDLVQYDLISGDGRDLPVTYQPGTSSPPGKNPLISTSGTEIPVLAAAVIECPPHENGECRMTGGINLSTNATNLGSSVEVEVRGGFQLRAPSRGTSNLELHAKGGELDLNIKMDKELTFFTCDVANETVTAHAGATVNGVKGYKLVVILDDNGEPGRNDRATVELRAPDNSLVLSFRNQTLNEGGNLQFHAK